MVANGELDSSSGAGAELARTAELLEGVLSGETQAELTLDRLYRPALARLLHRKGQGSLHATEDLVQDVLAQAYRSLANFEYRGPGSFWSFVRTIAMNRVRQEWRRRPVAQAELLEASHAAPSAPGLSVTGAVVERDELMRVEAARERLSEREREVVDLRFELGLTYPELAQAAGLPSPDAARMAVVRALQRMTSELGAQAEESA